MLKSSARFGAVLAVLFAIPMSALLRQTAFGQDGILQTAAGTGDIGSEGDGGPATEATFMLVTGLVTTPDGTTYVADYGASVIRRIDPDGTIHTICGTPFQNGYSGNGGDAAAALLSAPTAVAVAPSGTIYIVDSANHVVRQIDPHNVIMTFAGSGQASFNGYDGIATQMELNTPSGIALDADGNVFITSTLNGIVHRVNSEGVMTTVVGDFERHGTSVGDGERAVNAGLNRPTGIAVAADGTLYLAEQGGHRIRRVSPDGIITTLAGTGVAGYSGDGDAAELAQFSFDIEYPNQVALDASGNLYVADSTNCAVRRVSAACCVDTLAGNGTLGYSGDGRWAFEGQLSLPYGVTVMPTGSVAIADSFNFRMRRVDQNFSATIGADVAVTIGGEAALTFSEVSNPGTVTVDVRQAYDPSIAGDLQLGSEYVDINTSAVFSGTISITLPFDDPDPTDPADEVVTWDLAQRVLHFTDGAWQDATKEIRPTPNEIVAEVNSLSPFAVVKVWPGYQSVNFRRGDANGDGSNDVSDAVRILLALFIGNAHLTCLDAGDVNDDGRVNISDAIALLHWLFLNGDKIPSPGAFGMGVDMTDDPLGCESYP